MGFDILGRARSYFHALGSAKWALADQTVVSGSNFLANILLARILGIEEFGRYVLAWTIVLFVQNLQSSTIASTMMSIGPKQEADAVPRFYGSTFILQAMVGLFAAAFTLVTATLVSRIFPVPGLDTIAVPLSVTILCSQTHDFLRRYFFSVGRMRVSFFLDATRYIGQTIAILALNNWFPANSVAALWLISVAAAVASLVVLPCIPRLHFTLHHTIKTGAHSWHFSKWLGGSTLMGFAFANLFTFAAGILLGAAAVGAMRAAFALVSITNLVIEAFANFVPVTASRELMSNGRLGLLRYLKKEMAHGAAVIAILLGIIVAGSKYWLHLFFGPAYEPYSTLIFWYAGIQFLTFIAFMIGTFYRTLENTRFIFFAYAFSAALSLIIAYPLLTTFGLSGAMLGLLIGQMAQLLYMLTGPGAVALR